MILTALLLASPLAALLPAQEEEQTETPTPTEEVETEIVEIDPAEAAKEIKEAFKAKKDDITLATLDAVGRIESKLVTKELAKGLKHQSQAVILAVLEALRHNPDPTALDVLVKQRNNKTVTEDVPCAVAYAHALGQKADVKAIKPLTDDLVATSKMASEVLKAKVTALGRIRHVDAVEAILDYSRTGRGGGRQRGGVRNMMREAQRSLMVLTGTDQGTSTQAWHDWWSDAKRGFKMSEKEWPLANGRDQRQWDNLWKTETEKEEEREQAKDKAKKKRGKDDDGSSEGSGEETGDDF